MLTADEKMSNNEDAFLATDVNSMGGLIPIAWCYSPFAAQPNPPNGKAFCLIYGHKLAI